MKESQTYTPKVSNFMVSAIVSAYNSEKYMAGRLQNLIDQSLYLENQLEIIVVDSGSRQNEAQIVKEFMQPFNHIVYLRTSKRESVYGAWNRGIQLAQGKYFINANTDDRFVENALEKMSDELEANRSKDAVYGDWLQTGAENDHCDSESPKELIQYPEFDPLLLFHAQTTSHAALIRKAVFEKIGLFNPDFKVYGDREFMLRFALNGLKAKKNSTGCWIIPKKPERSGIYSSCIGPSRVSRAPRQVFGTGIFCQVMGS